MDTHAAYWLGVSIYRPLTDYALFQRLSQSSFKHARHLFNTPASIFGACKFSAERTFAFMKCEQC